MKKDDINKMVKTSYERRNCRDLLNRTKNEDIDKDKIKYLCEDLQALKELKYTREKNNKVAIMVSGLLFLFT